MRQLVDYPGIGVIEVVTRGLLRGTTYRVTAKGVRITTSALGLRRLFPLDEDRVRWIQETRERLLQRVPNGGKIVPSEAIKTTHGEVRFVASDEVKGRFVVRFLDGVVEVLYNAQEPFEKDEMQMAVRRILRQVLLREAKVFLPQRLEELAQRYGFVYNGVRINGATSRWGSCSAQKRINLSLYLMLLEEELIDFVLVHELCHTEEMNHGPRFKARLNGAFEKSAMLNARLKQEGKRLLLYKL